MMSRSAMISPFLFMALLFLLVDARDQPRPSATRTLKGKMHLKMRMMMGAKKAPMVSSPPYDEIEFSAEDLESLCTLFEVFDNVGRDENNDPAISGFEWANLCDNFSPFNHWLCPSEEIVQNEICTDERPWLNEAVRKFYCGPLLANMPDAARRASCETWCTNYVSQDRGNCCAFECIRHPYIP